jgi:hypothetical protein
MLDIVSAMDDPGLFGPWFRGSSWNSWRAVLKAAFALPMTSEEITFFRSVAERDPPATRVHELWIIAGRRGGKDSIASLVVAHAAALFEHGDRLRPGERALCMALACDRDQAKIVLNYTRSYFTDIPPLHVMVTRETANGFELDNGVDIAIGTNNFRSVRGRPILCAVLDECAFYQSENSASPDEETYRAIVPGMATLPSAMLIGISTPYKRSGLLYKKHRAHFGQDGDVLVIQAPSILLNPTLDRSIIDQAMEDDPEAARAEWLAEFRSDLESYISPEAVDSCVAAGCHELPYQVDHHYAGAVDAAGGSGLDSFTMAIGHLEDGRGILDVVREVRPPFSPESAVAEFATLFKAYGVRNVVADKWGAGFVTESFSKYGVTCEQSAKPKSDIYRELLPALNSGRIQLLDNRKLVTQLCNLERRTARGGRDSIDHSHGGHDDIANAAALVLVDIVCEPDELSIWLRAYDMVPPRPAQVLQ